MSTVVVNPFLLVDSWLLPPPHGQTQTFWPAAYRARRSVSPRPLQSLSKVLCPALGVEKFCSLVECATPGVTLRFVAGWFLGPKITYQLFQTQ